MKDKEFETAIWGFSWDELFESDACPVQGAASLTRDGLVLEIPFGCLLGDGLLSFNLESPTPTEADFVYGFSRKGEYLALSQARVPKITSSTPGGDSQSVAGGTLMSSKAKFNPIGKVSRMAVGMTGLKEWVGEHPLHATLQSDTLGFKAIEYDCGGEDPLDKELFVNDELSISVSHVIRWSPPTVAGANLTHDCMLEIAFADPRDLDGALDTVFSLSRFLSICLGFYAEFQEVKLYMDDPDTPVKLYANFIRGTEPTKDSILRIPVPLKSIETDIGSVLGRWLHAGEDLRTASEMTASLVSGDWNTPIDLRFLAASQALEALTRIGADIKSLPKETYRKYRKIVLSSIQDREVKEWIEKCMPGNQKGQDKRLSEALDRHAEIVDWLIPDREQFLKAQKATRNYYTHRHTKGNDENLLEGEDLHWHTEALVMLCLGIIWENLGITWDRFMQFLGDSCYKAHTINMVGSLYNMTGRY